MDRSPTLQIPARLFGVILTAAALLLSIGCPPDGEPDRDYRADMRTLIQDISAYAKTQSPDFLIVPQNGEELFTATGTPSGTRMTAYLAAIDGAGREDLNYGYNADDVATPISVRNAWAALLDVGESRDVEALVIDYCSSTNKVLDSYLRNAARGYAGFAADHRELDNIPTYPVTPYGANDDDVETLADVRNFLFLLDPGQFASRQAYLDALAATDYDLLIIDLFYDESALTPAEVASLRIKDNGGARLVIAYMSIGEAEDYRYYWQAGWSSGSPAWIDDENPDWPGNFRVQYWDPAWRAVLFGQSGSYLQRILDAGFDGVYLDTVDTYEFFED